MKATRVEQEPSQPGEYRFVLHEGEQFAGRIEFCCPCGCGTIYRVPVNRQQSDHVWAWNGNQDSPDFPSSFRMCGTCRYHGTPKKGEWVQAQ